ncbi:MAG: pyridoxamine 5'-phosphate oxidase family protein [Eubacterium sp.]|nr:pyridoxamine 5'-phosphate oxidase family protein [Eubacterium sp.]
MFRKMRRFKQQISDEQSKELLKKTKRGILSLAGDEGYPYGIPMNFYYDEEDYAIYFHSAKEGHKIDAIARNDKVCFTVMNNDRIDEKDGWSYHLESVVVFGRASIVEDEEVKWSRARKFAGKYFPSDKYVEQEMHTGGMERMALIKISIEHMTGKTVHEK